MKKINFIYLLVIIVQIILIIFFHIKFVSQYDFKDFMASLQEREYERNHTDDDIMIPYEKVFNRYYDNAGLSQGLSIVGSFLIMISTIITLITSGILQFCIIKKNCGRKGAIVCIVYSFIAMMIYLVLGFNAEYKVNLKDEEIYVYDDEFNQEIKKNINFMKTRKIILILFSILVIFGIIFEFIVVVFLNNPENTSAPENEINKLTGAPSKEN